MIKDLIVLFILIAIVAGIVYYLVRQKKQGAVCVGCPYAKQCGGNCANAKQKNE